MAWRTWRPGCASELRRLTLEPESLTRDADECAANVQREWPCSLLIFSSAFSFWNQACLFAHFKPSLGPCQTDSVDDGSCVDLWLALWWRFSAGKSASADCEHLLIPGAVVPVPAALFSLLLLELPPLCICSSTYASVKLPHSVSLPHSWPLVQDARSASHIGCGSPSCPPATEGLPPYTCILTSSKGRRNALGI